MPNSCFCILIRTYEIDHCSLSLPLHVYPVQTHDFQACIKSICATRQNAWVDQIYGRIEAVNDLHAADTIYHQTCNVNFRIGKHT